MKKLLLTITLLFTFFFLALPAPLHAASPAPAADTPLEGPKSFQDVVIGGLSSSLTGFSGNSCPTDLSDAASQNIGRYYIGSCDSINAQALLPQGGKVLAMLYRDNVMPSSREYFANLFDNIGLPGAKQAFAQGTGYTAMSPFLPIWQAFRNLAYTVYIIMFVVIGIMIMFRTKVGGQTIVTIQSAIPNLLITLILITFSYAIVGFMIDLMYFLIYFVVFLVASSGLVSDPNKLVTRLMSYSAWSVIFEGRNSIISVISLSLKGALTGLGTGALGVAGGIIGQIGGWTGILYLIIAIAMAIAMIKLMFVLVKSYVMLIVQTVTAPVQIMLNAMPGSKSFSTWLKTTASYLIPFPVAGAMFIFAAIFIGDPSRAILIKWGGDNNPFGINTSSPFYKNYGSTTGADTIWLPPFTLTGSTNLLGSDIMSLIGFFIFLMTPATIKMAQEWLQVKESPYASEALAGFVGVAQTGIGYPIGLAKSGRDMHEQRRIQEYGASRYAEEMKKVRNEAQGSQASKSSTPVT